MRKRAADMAHARERPPRGSASSHVLVESAYHAAIRRDQATRREGAFWSSCTIQSHQPSPLAKWQNISKSAWSAPTSAIARVRSDLKASKSRRPERWRSSNSLPMAISASCCCCSSRVISLTPFEESLQPYRNPLGPCPQASLSQRNSHPVPLTAYQSARYRPTTQLLAA